jgi:hypothetical protein
MIRLRLVRFVLNPHLKHAPNVPQSALAFEKLTRDVERGKRIARRIETGMVLSSTWNSAPGCRSRWARYPSPLQASATKKSATRRFCRDDCSGTLATGVLYSSKRETRSSPCCPIDVANRVAQLPVVIIGTYRDAQSENNPAFFRTMEELIRLGIRPLKLGGLSKDAVAQMLNWLSQRQAPESLVSLIFEESQGNPFFVEEVYRHLLEEGKVFDEAGQFRTNIKVDESDVPESVRLVVGRRLERLGYSEKRVLAAAAVVGRKFSFQLLNAISRSHVDELFTVIEKAQRMGIIVASSKGSESPFTFTHELVRQTLLAGISGPRRQRLHASAADAIARLQSDTANDCAGDIADHLAKAGSFATENYAGCSL